MLSFFRKRAAVVKIVFGVLLVLVCVSMVITLIPGLPGGGTTADPAAIEVVAQVGGERITTFDLRQNLMQTARANNIPSEMIWLYAQQLLDQMVLEKATVQEAQRLGLRVSDEELRTRLRQVPELFPQGRFVGQQQYEDLVIERFGVSVEQFEQRFRDSLLTEKLRQLVTDSIGVGPEEIHEFFVRENEKFVLRYVFVTPESIKDSIKPTDAELGEYFQANRARYQLPEKRTVKVLQLDNERAKQGMSVSDAERRRYYQDRLDDYRQPERVQASHILFRVADKDPAKLAEARKRAEDLLKLLKAGADFADLAKRNSQDTANAPKGGDLGWIVRGQTVPEFEKAAFGLTPGSLSEPVQTEFGIHLIKVAAHEVARLRPLEEVQPEIDRILLDQKVQAMLGPKAEEAAAAWRSAPEDAEQVASQFQGTVATLASLARGDPIVSMPGAEALADDIFVLEKGQIGRPVPVPVGYAIPYLLEISPARPAELAEVKDRVRTEYVNEQSRNRAQAQMIELAQLTEKQERRDLAQAARSLGLTAKTSEALTRAGTIPTVGTVRELGPRLNTLEPGGVAGPVPIGGGQIVYQVESRQPPKEEDLAAQRDALRQQILGEKRYVAFAAFQDDLRKRLMESGDLTIDQEALGQVSVLGLPQ
jgi:peptidyl-prolyl cis-trans isomerase D